MNFLKNLARKGKNALCAVAVGATGLMASTASAAGEVTMPDIGVDVGSLVTSIGTIIGVAIVAVVGLWGAIYCVRFAIGWIRSMVR